jgi:hypothetical protein
MSEVALMQNDGFGSFAMSFCPLPNDRRAYDQSSGLYTTSERPGQPVNGFDYATSEQHSVSCLVRPSVLARLVTILVTQLQKQIMRRDVSIPFRDSSIKIHL